MNILGLEITMANGKTDWQLLRRILYTILVTWVVCVRLLNIDPLGLAKLITIAWVLDAMTVWAIVLVIWHLWPLRPK